MTTCCPESLAWIARVASMPSTPGRPMSINTTSGVCSSASRTASSPLSARATTMKRPSESSVSSTRAASLSSSSQMRMRSGSSVTKHGACHSPPYDAAVIIDGHNDLVLHRWQGEPTMHLDLDDARAAGFAGGFFALHVPSPGVPDPAETPYALPLPEPIPFDGAAAVAEQLFAELCALPVRRARSADDFQAGEITAIVHMEGAEPIAPDLSNLESWYERGLRSIGLVWSRPNAFAEGVPFRYPSSPDTGPGLTDAGRELVRACNRLGILVDLSHLNERGFRDVAELSTAPLVATHSNSHALCPASRNL